MNFPAIDRSKRRREYDSYSFLTRSQIVYSYLFEGLSHRVLDNKFLGLDSQKSKGWQSMGILHFLGLKGPYRNFFKDMDINSAIGKLSKIETNDAHLIIDHLKAYQDGRILDKDTFERQFEKDVQNSLHGDRKKRQKNLDDNKDDVPEKIKVISNAFRRNPDVVAEVLERANGVCESCGQNAPFFRAKDSTPYLEVHHKIRLVDGGRDNVKNAIALCPNCHKKAHFGKT